jgi:hypothetical protein
LDSVLLIPKAKTYNRKLRANSIATQKKHQVLIGRQRSAQDEQKRQKKLGEKRSHGDGHKKKGEQKDRRLMIAVTKPPSKTKNTKPMASHKPSTTNTAWKSKRRKYTTHNIVSWAWGDLLALEGFWPPICLAGKRILTER